MGHFLRLGFQRKKADACTVNCERDDCVDDRYGCGWVLPDE